MHLDVLTITFCAGLVFSAETIALYAQYRVNTVYDGRRWWLLGALFQALGFLAMITMASPTFWFLAAFANPFVFLGQLCLNAGVRKFLGLKPEIRRGVLLFSVFLAFYLYFILIDNSILGRGIVVGFFSCLIAFIIAFTLFRGGKGRVSLAARFTGCVFLVFGLLLAAVTVMTCVLPPIRFYREFSEVLARSIVFLLPIPGSILWTFGFVIMVNQRLNAENLEEREKLRLIFDASPDGNLITRLDDGGYVDVNEGFLRMTGYGRGELMEASTLGGGVWDNPRDREEYVAEIKATGSVEGKECLFRRKDGSRFIAIVSGGLVMIDGREHIVSVLHDITERKSAEERIRQLARQLAIEKETAELNAVTDGLTGLSNRRRFDEVLRSELSRLSRSGFPLSLIMMDIDLFKSYNDTYGHVAGDECLRRVAALLKAKVGRSQDTAARYGGEEFAVIMPETGEDGAAVLAEKIRKGVEELDIPHSASVVAPRVTVSLGVVTLRPTAATEDRDVVARADAALYEAKASGRNVVRIAGTPDGAPESRTSDRA